MGGAMQLVEHLKINGAPTPLSTFVVPQMSLSSARASMTRHTFEFAINAEALVEHLQPAYCAWVTESRNDDAISGGPQDALALAGYPEFRQVLTQPLLLKLVVGGYLLEAFLRELTWNGSDAQAYWLDTVTDCCLEQGLIYLRGVCYSKIFPLPKNDQTISADK